MNDTTANVRWDKTNDRAIAQTVRHARIPLCITDPQLPDNPIVFVNRAFLTLTGYDEAEVLGRNCRFLQGPETSRESVQAVRAAIEGGQVETVELVNYRKDGSSFVNALQIGPILDDAGEVLFFFGSQLDVTEKREAERRARKLAEDELIHRLRNIVNVMSVMIRMTAREEPDARKLGALVTERLAILSDAHFQTIRQPKDEALALGDLARGILSAYAPGGARQFTLAGPTLSLQMNLQSCVALCLHELATNSVKHGALGAEQGMVAVTWTQVQTPEGQQMHLRWQESGGPEVVQPERASGSKIIGALLGSLGGRLALDWQATGLIATVDLPL